MQLNFNNTTAMMYYVDMEIFEIINIYKVKIYRSLHRNAIIDGRGLPS